MSRRLQAAPAGAPVHAAARAALGVVLAAGLAACSGGHSAAPPAPRPSASAFALADGETMVAASLPSGAVELHRVGRDRRARRVATLRPPATGDRPQAVSLTGGASPRACVAWGPDETGDTDASSPRTVWCYPPGSAGGALLPGVVGRVVALALRPDGGALAWVDVHGPPAYRNDVLTAELRDGAVVGVRRIPPDPGADCPNPECLFGLGPNALAWAGAGRLVMSMSAESDDGPFLRLLPLGDATVRRGWRAGSSPVHVPESEAPYALFDDVGGADARTALVVERAGDFEQDPPARRAVRVELATGRVIDVVATPLPGREVVSVSGGGRGVLYATAPGGRDGPLRVYLRLPGERRGTRVTGLPPGVVRVVAQP